jgi:hypothetical protein
MEEEIKTINAKLDFMKYKIKKLERYILLSESYKIKYENEKNEKLSLNLMDQFNFYKEKLNSTTSKAPNAFGVDHLKKSDV